MSDLDQSSSRSVINMKYDTPKWAEGYYALVETIDLNASNSKGSGWGEQFFPSQANFTSPCF